MDFVGVSAGLELILGGKRSFEVWRTAVFERSESSEASPIFVDQNCCWSTNICWELFEMDLGGVEGGGVDFGG